MASGQIMKSQSYVSLCLFGIILLMAGILVLLLGGNIYALLFDRTDILLGIPLDGWQAGISLLAKIIVEVVLIIFIVRYPASFDWFVKISLVFSGFLLVNSIIAAQTALQGYSFVSLVPGIFFLSGIGLAAIQMLKHQEGNIH